MYDFAIEVSTSDIWGRFSGGELDGIDPTRRRSIRVVGAVKSPYHHVRTVMDGHTKGSDKVDPRTRVKLRWTSDTLSWKQ